MKQNYNACLRTVIADSIKKTSKRIGLILGIFFGVVANAGAQSPYCAPGQLECGVDDIVSVFTMAGTTNYPSCSNFGYQDYTTTVPTRVVIAGNTYPVTVETDYGGEQVGLWIDYNHNNTFDATEFTYIGQTASTSNTPLTTNVVIPTTALTGVTRMRLSNIWYASGSIAASNACMGGYGTFAYGNTGDYLINIAAPSPPSCIASPTLPVNNALSVCTGSTTLRWPAAPFATSYDVYLNTGTLAPTTIVSTSQADTFFTTTVATGSYTWKIIPKNTYGSATGCTFWSFTVIPNVVPDVTITASPGSTACIGSAVTFTATPVNGGTTPVYQWLRNGSGVATNSPTFSYVASAAFNGDRISVVLTSNAVCAAPVKDTSNVLTMNFIPRPTASVTSTGTTVCAGDSIQLKANAGTGLTYQWFYNNAAATGGTDSSFYAKASGSYRVAVSNGGCTDTSTASVITVNPLPIVTVSLSGPASFCANDQLLLSAYNDATYTYQWYRLGLPIAGATSSTYTVLTAGSYTVTAIANGCSATSSAVVTTILPAPVANITAAGPTSFCSPGSVILNASLGTGLSYSWLKNGTPIFPAVTTSTYTATTSGAYTVNISNGSCGTTSSIINVVANTLAPTTVTPLGNTTFCQGNFVTLRATLNAAYTYQWYRNGIAVAPGGTGYQINAGTAGIYYVIITNGACTTTSVSTTITVNALPSAVVAPSGPLAFCQGGSVVLTAPTGAGYTYRWRRNGANLLPSDTNIAYTATISGNYQVNVSNGICATTSPSVSVVVSTPVVATITAQGPTTFCDNNSVVLKATPGANYVYQWQKNGVNIAGANTATYTASVSGYYRAVIRNGTCVDTSAPLQVSVTPAPPANITASGTLEFCQGATVKLTANLAPGYNYQWSKDGNLLPGDTNRVITVTQSGSYTVEIFDGFCPGVSSATIVNVHPVPVAVVSLSGGNVLSVSGSYSSYQWYRNGAVIDGATSTTHTADRDGFYAVVVSDNIGCNATSNVYHLSSLGLNSIATNGGNILIYPNPATELVNVDAGSLIVDATISTVDGRLVKKVVSAQSINIHDLSQGVYFISIIDQQSGKILKTEKLVKGGK